MGGISDSMDVSLSKLRELVRGKDTGGAAAPGLTKRRTRPSE